MCPSSATSLSSFFSPLSLNNTQRYVVPYFCPSLSLFHFFSLTCWTFIGSCTKERERNFLSKKGRETESNWVKLQQKTFSFWFSLTHPFLPSPQDSVDCEWHRMTLGSSGTQGASITAFSCMKVKRERERNKGETVIISCKSQMGQALLKGKKKLSLQMQKEEERNVEKKLEKSWMKEEWTSRWW